MSTSPQRATIRRGAALLEVIFALVLFAAAAGVIYGGLTWSARQVGRSRLEATAADLAVTLLSEIQMGLVEPAADGPTAYDEPMGDWNWQIVTGEFGGQLLADSAQLTRVEIIIRHQTSGVSYRLGCLIAPASSDGRDDLFARGGRP